MACLPTDCRCEERILDPFIRFYNGRTGSTFSLVRRLDIGNRRPAPEALYADTSSGQTLVIERKNLVWPPDFAKIHRSLHSVTGITSEAITPYLEPERAYRLEMPSEIRGTLPELRAHGRTIGRAIVENLGRVHEGEAIGSTKTGREWSFRTEIPYERDFNEPTSGVRYVFSEIPNSLDWGEVPAGLTQELQRLLDGASSKFEPYLSSHRLLVLDFVGDVRYSRSAVLATLFMQTRVPRYIGEIWSSTYDLLTELDYGWIYQPLWPQLGEKAYELSGVHR